jgi:hypothetical protein
MSGLTLFHVVVSLLAILSGIIVAQGFIVGRRHENSTLSFMVTTIVTVMTGFFFPYHGFTPAIGVGILCVAIYVPTALARYTFHMAGIWRHVFIVGSLLLFFFNCLVLIIQSFQKVPFLNALSPTGNEPPIVAVQVALLIAFLVLGFLSLRRFRPGLPAF